MRPPHDDKHLFVAADGVVALDLPLTLSDAITVEAWVSTDTDGEDAIQPLVSAWAPKTAMTGFDAYDAGMTDGLDSTGFFGAVFDGRHVYFVPQHDTDSRHGKVLRYDTHCDFKDVAAWEAYDAGQTNGLNSKGYYGAVADGRYITFIPRRDSEDFHSRILRYDTAGGFKDPESWDAHDIGLPNSYQSAAFDGRYIYCCPGQQSVPADNQDDHDEGHSVTGMKQGMVPLCSGTMLRIDTHCDLQDPAGYATYAAEGTDGLDTRDFDGACFDGRYVYYAPLSYGAALRYDSSLEFADPVAWSAYDARPLGLVRNVGAIYDGQYVYYVPYGETEAVVRYDTRQDFKEDKAWQSYDLTRTSGRRTLGYDGACCDGRFVYFIPYWDAGDDYHGEFLRYDTAGEFTDPAAWCAVDAGLTDGLKTVGFNAAAFDGRFIYGAPWNDGARHPGLHGHGAVLRYDTIGDLGSFSLRYADCGHNGGLCAALPGPRFLVATEAGVVSIAANRRLAPGPHYLAGVYDGRSITLYIDGVRANEQPASGRIQASDIEITIGRLAAGAAVFPGTVKIARVSDCARDGDWIRTQHEEVKTT